MKTFSIQIVIEKEPEDEGYFAHSPALPGCFSNGATVEATRENMRQAVEQHLAALGDRGMPLSSGADAGVVVEELSVALPE